MTSSATEFRPVAVEQLPPRARPRTQYWDHRTATWQMPGPIPTPRRGG